MQHTTPLLFLECGVHAPTGPAVCVVHQHDIKVNVSKLRHVGDVPNSQVVRVAAIHGQQVARKARVLGRKCGHGHRGRPFDDVQAGRGIVDAVGRRLRPP